MPHCRSRTRPSRPSRKSYSKVKPSSAKAAIKTRWSSRAQREPALSEVEGDLGFCLGHAVTAARKNQDPSLRSGRQFAVDDSSRKINVRGGGTPHDYPVRN